MKKIFFTVALAIATTYGCHSLPKLSMVKSQGTQLLDTSTQKYTLIFKEYDSIERCKIQNYGKSWEDIKYFLKLNGIDFKDGHWLMSPYACSLVKYENTKYMIYQIIDKDSPAGVIYLINLNNKNIALAKIYRDSGISFYADGKREFAIDETHFPEARYILDQYINTLTHY